MSGARGTVHIEQVLEYNKNPGCLRDHMRVIGATVIEIPSEACGTIKELIRSYTERL